ncbi:MAG: hypothetical protein R6X02_18490 [Enhygromyxa sp.]
MTRAIALVLPLSLALACVASRTPPKSEAPTLVATASSIPEPDYALPFHDAPIVDLAMLPAGPGERWRMVSGDLQGWIRFWADGRLLGARHAHPGGLAALVRAGDGTLYTAGFDGRIREWSSGATSPSRTFRFGRQVTALAVSDDRLAISDGHIVQLWTRGEEPQLEWSTPTRAFVTGLALSSDGSMVAAAELRESAMRDAIATHPLASFEGVRLRAVDPEEAADLAYLAERDFPGAVADLVQVWQPGHKGGHLLTPQAPIDAEIGVVPGGVIYREIRGREITPVIGRRLEDRAHVSLTLVKPWALFSGESQASEQGGVISVDDFVLGPSGEVIVVDHFPGWDREPPAWGWRVGERRELAIDYGFAALGDGMGNLAVVDLAAPSEPGWQAPGEERPELLAAGSNQPWIATATLEPRTQYRLWSLGEGLHRALRVEHPEAVIDQEQPNPAPMYPVALALDDDRQTLATSLSSFSDPQQAAIRLLTTADGRAQILTRATTPHPLELALSPSADELIAWTPGYPGFRWQGPTWSPSEAAVPSGAPQISANGRYAAHVSPLERTLVDRQSKAPVVVAKVEQVISELGAAIPAALANDGTLAVVEPFGGGVVQLLAIDGSQAVIELPGAATALAWIDDRELRPTLIIGFEDGSIVRVNHELASTVPIHAGAGGRVWALAPLGGRPAVYVELDERGLALHRLDDDALLELHLGDATTLARHAGSPPQEPSSAGLVAVWLPGAATPACAIFDGSSAGVLASASVRRVGPAEGSAFFEAFAAGGPCPVQAPVAPIEPVSPSDQPG